MAGEKLGEGASAVVKLATGPSGDQYAMKIVKKRGGSLDAVMMRETELLRAVGSHPNVVSLVDAFELPDTYVFVLNLARGGEVFDRICEHGPYSERDAAAIVRQVALALQHVHMRGVCHRDIKPENLLFSDKTEGSAVQLCDFGCAARPSPPFSS